MESESGRSAPPDPNLLRPSPRPWGRLRAFGFRFLFAYALLYTIPELFQMATRYASALVMTMSGIDAPNQVFMDDAAATAALARAAEANPILRVLDQIGEKYKFCHDKWDAAVVGFNEKILGARFTIDKRPLGSGDTQWNYIEVAFMASLALLTALLWTVLHFRSAGYPRLAGLLVFLARWYLVLYLLSYGFAKVIPTQFGNLRLDDLVTTYGDSSPMGLVWRFMGFSTVYCVFCGVAEVLGGFLLAFRRTTTLGAMAATAALANVVMINYCYDVPVKLFSSHLLLAATGLLARDLPRFVDFFVRNRATQPLPMRPFLGHRFLDVTATMFKLVVLGWVSWSEARQGLEFRSRPNERSPLYGAYDVVSFKKDGQELDATDAKAARWNLVVIENPMAIYVRCDDRNAHFYGFTPNVEAKTVAFVPDLKKPESTATWTYDATSEPGVLALDGDLDGAKISIKMKARDTSHFLVVDRGFHWVNEVPLNR